ncbi:DeoR/GlpR family DNA-binding transcription regulator [Cohnella sp.]|uniref:DeoR/GlpR family DNA-binding transcription regulator n=1 Tax=Cohnella sp. TaxID=1883426 RepID=UPI0035670B89
MSDKRLGKLAELIKQRGNLSVQELMDYFNVSDMTIRRDLQKLENSGKFQRFHGGIRFLDETPLDKREHCQLDEKKRIAHYCLSLIQPRDTIILDSGTTTSQIAAALADSDIRDVTVITNSLTAAHLLRNQEHVSLVISGGELRHISQSFVGSTARTFFENVYVNKAFIATGGITEKGFSTSTFAEAEIKQCMANSSSSTYIVTDSSKFGSRSLNFFAPLEAANAIVTDTGVPDEWVALCKQHQIEVCSV